jgi:hypothetical protein
MWKKLTILTLALVLITLSMAAVASADSVHGNGWLEAQGNGRACMSGNADAITISGNGVLWYFDDGEEDTPVITGEGHHQPFANGWQRWKGFDGEFSLTDADEVIVCLRGEEVQLRAEGTGVVALTGRGHYETGSDEGRWTLTGVEIQLGQQ